MSIIKSAIQKLFIHPAGKMLSKKQNILFVSHQASRSGAPVLLLELIREFKKHENIPIRILLMRDGDLANDFKALAKTYIWKPHLAENATSLSGRILKRLSIVSNGIAQRYVLFCLRKTGIIFTNTLANGAVQKRLLYLNCPFICYVHELENAIRIATKPSDLSVVLKRTDLFIAVSNAVKNNLECNHGVDEKKLKVIPTSVPVIQRKKDDHINFIAAFKKENNIPANAIIIGVAAPNEWRKGFDLFLPLLSVYFNLFPESEAYFVWKGFKKNNPTSFFDLYDAKQNNHSERARLLPHDKNSIETIACFDIHLLLSREDPYPLVVLEAASFAIPTVCFAGAGGSPEFIEDDCGFCVPYGDLMKMAARIHEFETNTELRNKMGLRAQEKLAERHDQKLASKEMIEAIRSVMQRKL